VDEIIMNTMQLVQRKYLSVGSKVKPLDFANLAQHLTLDVITYLSLGKPFGFITEDTDKYGYVKAIEENFPVINLFSAVPILSSISRIPAVQKFLIPTIKDKSGLGKAKAYVSPSMLCSTNTNIRTASRKTPLNSVSPTKKRSATTW
jgi:hypothetical protein